MRTYGAQSFRDEDLNVLMALSTPRMPATALLVQLLDCLGLLWGCLPQCCSLEVLTAMWRPHTGGLEVDP